MIFSSIDLPVVSMLQHFHENRNASIELSNPDLTPEAFDSICSTYPRICILNSNFGFCAKALQDAIGYRNLDLVEHIIEIAGNTVFLVEGLQCETALHYVSTDQKKIINNKFSIGTTPETREYYIAKKLLQRGSPVNIIRGKKESEFCPIPTLGFKTPLDSALEKGKIKIAALLLRHGGISISYKGENLELAKKNIIYENEKLFKISVCDIFAVPKDVSDYILFLSCKAELND